MKRIMWGTIGLMVLCATLPLQRAVSMTQVEREEIATLLALLLDSGRVVLTQNQDLINDPTRGDKGFTAAAFEAQVVQEFHRRSRLVDLARLDETTMPQRGKDLLRALLAVGKAVIEQQQALINEQGKGFKNLVPATWGTLTTRKFSEMTGVHLKQTALDPRNPINAPDCFERTALRTLAHPKYPRDGELVISELTDGGKTLRVMLPLYYTQKCLACHGTPKGEIDIAGYKKEGHKLGDLAGAISVALPAQDN
jgi:general secretion pathway protein A